MFHKFWTWPILLSSFAVFGETIHRPFYSLDYNEQHEVANWVAYSLDHFKLRNCFARNQNFKADPLVSTGSAVLQDYKGSGFDRGHLLPAGDMKFDALAMHDTFYLSNVTPQPAKFNQGRWAQLEGLIRAWALRYKNISIVTGPVLRPDLAKIGVMNAISVPLEYFKVVLRKAVDGYKGIGFLMSVDVPYRELKLYTVSIDQIEDLVGLDFFSFMEDSEEDQVESTFEISDWDFNENFEYLPCAI